MTIHESLVLLLLGKPDPPELSKEDADDHMPRSLNSRWECV